MVTDPGDTAGRYAASCRRDFWQEVFRVELDYLARHLDGCRDVLSIGCGPAFIEAGLARLGFNVTGLDVSQEALDRAPDLVRTVAGRAEDMPFPGASFDAVISVTSLQFVDDWEKALARTVSVLRPGGRVIFMLLNPRSAFVKEKLRDPGSYIQRMRHRDLDAIEDAARRYFRLETEYFMGVRQGEVFESRDPVLAALYVLRGTKRSEGSQDTPPRTVPDRGSA